MPERVAKKDAIEYLLYMKHDVQAGSPVDVAIDTAIEALKATVKQPKTNGDRIRQMTDEEICVFMINVKYDWCSVGDRANTRCSDCEKCFSEWLKQEVQEE